MKGSHSNRKVNRDELAHATQVIQEAFPEYVVVWGSHRRLRWRSCAPRPHTLLPTPRPLGQVPLERYLGVPRLSFQHQRRVG